MSKIKLLTCESGDWQVLKCNEFKVSNHSITYFDWINLLKYLGYEVDVVELSDDEMEVESN